MIPTPCPPLIHASTIGTHMHIPKHDSRVIHSSSDVAKRKKVVMDDIGGRDTVVVKDALVSEDGLISCDCVRVGSYRGCARC